MKKNVILLSVLIIVSFSFSPAQTYWDVLGNGSISSTSNFLGTLNNADLSFRTNNLSDPTSKMQLEVSGALGLGTTSPGSWFHVLSNGNQETFRTDVNDDINNYWRMYRNGTEYARLYHLAAGSAFYVHAARGNLRMGAGNAV